MPDTMEAPAGVNIVHDRPAPRAPAPTERRSAVVGPGEFLGTMKKPAEGSAKSDFRKRLEQKAGITPPAAKPEERPGAGEETPPADAPELETAEETKTPPTTTETPPAKPAETAAGKKPGKVNPWNELKSERQAHEATKAELHKMRLNMLPENDKSVLNKQIQDLSQKLKTYEDEIRFVSYEKSPEFEQQFNAPYEKAWKDATDELGQLTVDDGAGGQRFVSAKDIQALTNMNLADAKKHAVAVFGDFANEAMGHRKAIIDLYKKRSQAIDDAKTKGAEREQQKQTQTQEQVSALHKEIGGLHQQITQAAMADKAVAKYISPIVPAEGKTLTEEEQEWNRELEAGEKFVAEGWSRSPLEPGISKEEKANRVKRHVAIWNRAKAFRGLRLRYERAEKRLSELQKTLNEIQDSNPPAGGRVVGARTAAKKGAKQSFHDRLARVAAK